MIKQFNLRIQLLFFIIVIFTFSGKCYSEESFHRITFVRDSLPNGMQIIYHIDRSAPIVATVMHYRVGSKDEDTNKTGYAHFFEHLMFEATENIPRASIDKYIEEASGTLNAYTSFDETVFFFVVPANEIKLPLWIESQRMRKLKLDTVSVETQRGVVLEELKMSTTNQPYGSMLSKMAAFLFPGTHYAWETIGSAEHIQNATIDDFKQFYNKYYQPNNVTLVIAGDFNIDSAKQYVRDYFGIYPKVENLQRYSFDLKPLNSGSTETIVDEKAQLPGIFIGFRGPALNDSNYYALNLLSNILASGTSSRIYQRLVDKEQLALEASMFPWSLQYSGAIIIYAIANQGVKLEAVQKAIEQEIKQIAKDGVSEEELTKAKNITESAFVFGKKNVLEKAKTLAKYYSYYSDPNMINTELEKYMKVTLEDIKRVARLYLDTDKKIILKYVLNKNK